MRALPDSNEWNPDGIFFFFFQNASNLFLNCVRDYIKERIGKFVGVPPRIRLKLQLWKFFYIFHNKFLHIFLPKLIYEGHPEYLSGRYTLSSNTVHNEISQDIFLIVLLVLCQRNYYINFSKIPCEINLHNSF